MQFQIIKSQLSHWHDKNKHHFRALHPFEPAAEAIAGMKPPGTMVEFRFRMIELDDDDAAAIQEFTSMISGGEAIFHTIRSSSSPIPELMIACEQPTNGFISAVSLVHETMDSGKKATILNAVRISSPADSQFFRWCIANGFDDVFTITLLYPFLSSVMFSMNRIPITSQYLDADKRLLNPTRWQQILAIYAKPRGWLVENIQQLPQEAENVLLEEESSYIRFLGEGQRPALFRVTDGSSLKTHFYVSVKPSIISRILVNKFDQNLTGHRAQPTHARNPHAMAGTPPAHIPAAIDGHYD